jgi:hypothetical protein
MTASNSKQETITLIQHIASELYNPVHSRMSVFVGSGFSKNADPQMPTWTELGKLFAQKLGISTENQQFYPQSIMEMADQITLMHGRATLNQIIKASTIESQNTYNDLHVKLAEQPWRDIFTTNYDRYIENAAIKILGIAYQTIIHPHQLVGSSSPRIIKLHGCISTEQFIISTEDYRTYPDKFAPYVNTVRQAFIEASCCLIGFSGADPNFKSWIGWVRDVLGQHQASKIYLISVKDAYTEAQKHLFAQQNIIVVDISVLTTENTHVGAIIAFFDELSRYKSNNSSLKVPAIVKKDIHEIIKEFTYQIQKLRASYLGWPYMPSDYRSRFQIYTLNHILHIIHNNPTENFQQLLPDLAWVLDMCLMPLSNEILALFQNHIDTSIKLERINSALLQPIIQLLLRHYRHTNKSVQWNSLYEIAKNLARKELDAEAQNLLHTENILQNLYQLNVSNIFTLLEDWPKVTTPYWQSRRAMLYAHFGDFIKASTILKQELERLRIEINTFQNAKQKHAMDLFTHEAIILFCLVSVERMLWLQPTENKKHAMSYDLYSNRSLYLRQYRIDIENEINLFESRITNNDYKNTTPWIRRTTNTLYDDDVNVTAYEYLTFLERVGITFPVLHTSINESAYQSLLHHLNRYFPYAATIYSLHSNNKNTEIHIEMNPAFLHNLANDSVDILCQNALQSCNFYTQKTSISRPPATYPAILTILATKARPNVRQEIFNFLKTTLATNKFNLFCDLDILLQSLMRSISPTEFKTYATDFINWGFQANTHNTQSDNTYWHPLMYLTTNKIHFRGLSAIDIDTGILSDLIAYSQLSDNAKRKWYSLVIFSILKHDIFSQSSKEYLIKRLPRDSVSTLPALSIFGSNLVPLAEQWGNQPSFAAIQYLDAILTGKVIIEHGDDYIVSQELVNVLWKLEQLKTAHDIYEQVYDKLIEQFRVLQNQADKNNHSLFNFFRKETHFYDALYYTTLFIFLPKFELLAEQTQHHVVNIVKYFSTINHTNNIEKGEILDIAYKIKNKSALPVADIYRELFLLQQNTELATSNAIDLFRAVFTFKLSSNDQLRLLILNGIYVWISSRIRYSRAYWLDVLHECIDEAKNDTTKLNDLYNVVTATIAESKKHFFEDTQYTYQSSIMEEINLLYRSSLLARKAYDAYKHKQMHPEIRSIVRDWVIRILDPNTTDDQSRPLNYEVERLIWDDIKHEFTEN